MKKFQELYGFIEKAEKSRKYSPNTSRAYRVALKVFEEHINDDEANSIELFKKNINQINSIVFNTNKFTSGSLAVYKSRVTKVIGDFENYGLDPVKMNSWTPNAVVPRIKRSKKAEEHRIQNTDLDTQKQNQQSTLISLPHTHKIELAIRKDVKCLIVVPEDMTKAECLRIKSLLDSLVIE